MIRFDLSCVVKRLNANSHQPSTSGMLHLKVLPLVQRVRRCVKFPVETSLQENHLCNASPPSRVEEKRWGPKNTFPETNKQLAVVGTVSTWKIDDFWCSYEISFRFNYHQTIFPLPTDSTNDSTTCRLFFGFGVRSDLWDRLEWWDFYTPRELGNLSETTRWTFLEVQVVLMVFGKGWGMMKTGESWVIV